MYTLLCVIIIDMRINMSCVCMLSGAHFSPIGCVNTQVSRNLFVTKVHFKVESGEEFLHIPEIARRHL